MIKCYFKYLNIRILVVCWAIFILQLDDADANNTGDTQIENLFNRQDQDGRLSITETLELAKHNFGNYRYDSARFHFESVLRRGGKFERIAALLGLSRIGILEYNRSESINYIHQAEREFEDFTHDSLRYVLRLNQILIGLVNGRSEAESELDDYIKKTPAQVADLLVAYEYKCDLLTGKKQYDSALNSLIEAMSFQNDYHSEKAYLKFRSGMVKESIHLYEDQIVPLLLNSDEGWATYLLGECLRLSAKTYYYVGNYSRALENNLRYLDIAKRRHSATYFRLGEIYRSIANIYSNLGLYSLSHEYLVKSSEIYLAQDSKDHLAVARLLYDKAVKFINSGDIDKAMSVLDQVIEFDSDDSRIFNFKFMALMLKTEALIDSGFLEQAKETIRYTEEFLQPLNEDYRVHFLFRVYTLQLSIFQKLGDSKKMEALFVELLRIYESGIDIRDIQQIYFFNQLSDYLIKENKADSALFYTNVVFEKYQLDTTGHKIDDRKLIFHVQNSFLEGMAYLGKAHDSDENVTLEQALKSFDQAIEFYMLSKKGYKPLEDDVYFDSSVIEIFEKAIETSLTLYERTKEMKLIHQAFQYAELSKAQQLKKSINRNYAIQHLGLPDSLLIKLNSLKEQSSYLKNEMVRLSTKNQTSRDSVLFLNFRDLLSENQEHLRNSLNYIEKNYRNYYDQLNNKEEDINIDHFQSSLKTNEGLIAYFDGLQNDYVFVMTTDTLAVNRLSGMSDSTITKYRSCLIPGNSGLQIDDLNELYLADSYKIFRDILSAPLAVFSGYQNIDKLFIVPDKGFNHLPFELLLTDSIAFSQFEGYGNLPYLIRDYDISYGYSSALLFEKKKSNRDYKGKLLALAPSYEQLVSDSVKMEELGQFRANLTLLKHNQSEIEGINEYFDGSILKSQEASEKAFATMIEDHDIVHLAMHGLIDHEDSQYSRLVFSHQSEDSIYDNYLHNFELYNMNIDLQMAVLSACNTGAGTSIGGEGVMSMARAFTYAGAKSVVMSRWLADDEATSEIMKQFYKFLAEGKTKDKAIRLAKLNYLRTAHPLKQHPYYWNNFMITGDISPIHVERRAGNDWLTYFFIGLSLCVFVLLLIRNKHLIGFEK